MSDGLCGCTPNSSDDCEFGQLQEQLADLQRQLAAAMEAIENEQHDIAMLCGHLTTIYDYMSRGRISKPNTLPSEVITVHEDLTTEEWNEWLKDETEVYRDIISEAPHGKGCLHYIKLAGGDYVKCDCWKSAALAQIEAGGSK